MRAKEAIVEAQREYAEATVTEYGRALDEEVARLQAMWQYGDALAAALGVSIPMPIPAKVSRHVVHAGEIERDAGAPVTITLPAPIQKLSAIVSRLDAGLSLCHSITRSKGFDMRRDKLQSLGSASAMQSIDGVFSVVAPAGILCGLDMLPYAQGTLVDADLIGPGPLQRLLVSRVVRRVDSLAFATTSAA
jgi:hypothetical protein